MHIGDLYVNSGHSVNDPIGCSTHTCRPWHSTPKCWTYTCGCTLIHHKYGSLNCNTCIYVHSKLLQISPLSVWIIDSCPSVVSWESYITVTVGRVTNYNSRYANVTEVCTIQHYFQGPTSKSVCMGLHGHFQQRSDFFPPNTAWASSCNCCVCIALRCTLPFPLHLVVPPI